MPQFTVVNLPSFKADPKRHGVRSQTVIACNFAKRLVLIGGTSYAGETKKSVFTFLNYAMPENGRDADALLGQRRARPAMRPCSSACPAPARRRCRPIPSARCSATTSTAGRTTASTISRAAATPRPSASRKEAEPEIWAATNRFGAVLENVILDPATRVPDFDDGRLTENTRSAYPLDFISNASKTGTAGHPKNIVMLTADAFGVLPPIAKLTPSQAMYHFLSGYTAKVAGTEKGVGSEPQATFSTCFGAPFMPRHPSVYGNLLRELIAKHNVDCWLVNTGWTGGKFGSGRRMPIKATRALLDAALSGALKDQPMRTDPLFGFQVPTALPGVEPGILNPRETWADKAAYDAQARALVDMFNKNFAKFEVHVDADVKAAAPALQAGGGVVVEQGSKGQ